MRTPTTTAMSSQTRPIQLSEFVAALKDLSDENIQLIQSQLRLSLQKLRETNDFLAEELTSTTDQADLNIYTETIEENKGVIENQESRLKATEEELKSRGILEKDEGVYL